MEEERKVLTHYENDARELLKHKDKLEVYLEKAEAKLREIDVRFYFSFLLYYITLFYY